jgi:hypothetical protein
LWKRWAVQAWEIVACIRAQQGVLKHKDCEDHRQEVCYLLPILNRVNKDRQNDKPSNQNQSVAHSVQLPHVDIRSENNSLNDWRLVWVVVTEPFVTDRTDLWSLAHQTE